VSAAAFFLVVSDVLLLAGGGSFTPSRRALDSPIACFGERRTVPATPNLFNLFPDELPRLRGRSFSFPLSFARSFDGLFPWHRAPPEPTLSSFYQLHLQEMRCMRL
jgi:hypothetical protein